MTVYVVQWQTYDEDAVEGVWLSQEAAQANYPKLTWVRCGDGVEAASLSYGSRLTIQPYEVHE